MRTPKVLRCPATPMYLILKYGPGIVVYLGIYSFSEYLVCEIGLTMVAMEKARQ